MKKSLIFFVLFMVFVSAFSLLMPSSARAALFDGSKQAACDGVEQSVSGTGKCDTSASNSTINSKLSTVIKIISLVVGVAAVIMIIVGGFKYITSAGDPAKVSSAKDTILYAIIGLIIVAMAQMIVRFVLKKATAPPPSPVNSGVQSIGQQVGNQISN